MRASLLIAVLVLFGLACAAIEPCDNLVDCFVDPCQGWSCGEFPDYTCQANYCGGCNRDWFNSAGEPAECENEIQTTVSRLFSSTQFNLT
jgi:hypothetical protein